MRRLDKLGWSPQPNCTESANQGHNSTPVPVQKPCYNAGLCFPASNTVRSESHRSSSNIFRSRVLHSNQPCWSGAGLWHKYAFEWLIEKLDPLTQIDQSKVCMKYSNAGFVKYSIRKMSILELSIEWKARKLMRSSRRTLDIMGFHNLTSAEFCFGLGLLVLISKSE